VSERNYAQDVAGEVRAEMARQGRTIDELAEVLEFKTRATARSRYDGDTAYDLIEIARVAMWLGVDVRRFTSASPAAGAA
jgi:hypothetical protein